MVFGHHHTSKSQPEIISYNGTESIFSDRIMRNLLTFKIRKMFLVVACIISIAFIDGFILQSAILGPQFRGNIQGVIAFLLLVIGSIFGQFISLSYARSTVLSSPSKKDLLSDKIWLLMKIVYCTISLLLVVLFVQMITTSSYSLYIALMVIGASGISSIVILSSLSLKMIRWSRLSRDIAVLSFTATILLLSLNLIFMTFLLIDSAKGLESIIRPSRCGLMCYSAGSVYVPIYWTSYLISFFALIGSSVVLLKGFKTGWQKVKFWAVLSISIILIVIRLDSILIKDLVDAFNLPFTERHYVNSILLGMIGPLAGIMAGLAFYFMARSITRSKVMTSVLSISFGVMIFLSLNQSVGLSHFQYPPFGIISISLIPLASYFLFVGVYYSAVYVAQDQKLRTMISSHNSPVFQELKFLSNIGESENYQQVVSGISRIVKSMAEKMEEESGVPSDWQENLGNYVQSALVMKLAMKGLRNGPQNYDITDYPLGLTWTEWVEEWWKWYHNLSIGAPLENTNKFGNSDRSIVNVWFLDNDFNENVRQKHMIPKGRGIFFPILKNLINFHEYPYLQEESDLRKYAKMEMDKPLKIRVLVDNIEIADVKKNRVHTRLFDIRVHSKSDDSIYVQTKAVSDGYWIFLRPLEPGSHVVHVIVEKIEIGQEYEKSPPEIIYDIEIV